MIARRKLNDVLDALDTMPVVVILGPRQVGKTTLSLEIGKILNKKVSYLDLELDSDFIKLTNAEEYLSRFENELLIIDEVQRKQDLFRLLRGIVDKRKQKGEFSGHFLLLGFASRDVIQMSSESLAGRIRFITLNTLEPLEIYMHDVTDKLWFRGGFPDSFLAKTDKTSFLWRNDFISTYIEKDIPSMGFNVSSTALKRFWSMLAHYQCQQINFSEFGRSLELSHTTIKNYLDILTDFYVVRQLQPWFSNTKKRLVKSPKIFIRDSGLLHNFLNITNFESLYSHPSLGASWEGFVIESILNILDNRWDAWYYRSHTQAEIDLVLKTPQNELWAIEIKRSIPNLSRGFYEACNDLDVSKKWVIINTKDRYPLKDDIEVLGLIEFLELILKFNLEN